MTTTPCREAPDTKEAAGTPKAPTATNTKPCRDNNATGRNGKIETTLGWSLFYEPLAGAHTIRDIRARLELKYVACLATGGTNGHPLHIDQIRDPLLKSIAGEGMNLAIRGWGKDNLLSYRDPQMIDTAAGVLMATLDRPVWGNHDAILMEIIEAAELMERRALKGGRIL